MQLFQFVWRVISWLVISILVLVLWSAADIAIFAQRTDDVQADAAIVLGAAAWGNRPSPIFRERINHGIRLYEAGQVDTLIFTGGQGRRGRSTEAEIGRSYAIQRGVPASDILLENQSRNTGENLANVVGISAENNLDTFLIVSTPFHQRRAVFVARQLGLDAYTSPTRTTRWRGNGTRQHLFTREVAAYLYYRIAWRPAPMLADDIPPSAQ